MAVVFSFCPDCGAKVHYRPEARVDIVVIPVGAFADPAFPAPTGSIDEQRMQARVVMSYDIDHLD